MSEIDWGQFSKDHGLSVNELKKEIFTAACVIGAMSIDKRDEYKMLKFTCSDDVGQIELNIKRV